jgi:peptidyl-prolyl cis-trans isomerase C
LKLLREPLLQFFFIGMCIYGAYALYGTPDEGLESNTIVVDAERIGVFKTAWQQRWNRPPTEQELNGLINQFIREDILYREAVAMGLGKDDPITRRRMAQKLEFLTKDIASLKEPEAGELEKYFEENKDQYKTPDLITFSHIFIDPDKRGDETLEDAAVLLAELQAIGPPDASVSSLGDRFMLQNYYPQKTELEIRKLFGSGFSASVMELEPGQWHGPVLSGYGTHLVYVNALEIAPPPMFEDVQASVMENWTTEQQEIFNEAFFKSLKSRYEIVIETAPLLPDNTDRNDSDVAEENSSVSVPAS